jgi:hypothetical protein
LDIKKKADEMKKLTVLFGYGEFVKGVAKPRDS